MFNTTNTEIKKSILDIVDNIAVFLFSNQVVISDLSVDRESEVNGEVSVSRFPFNNEKKVEWFFKFEQQKWYYKNQLDQFVQVPLNRPFRLPVYKILRNKDVLKSTPERHSFIQKFQHYLKFNNFISRIFKYLNYKVINKALTFNDRHGTRPNYIDLSDEGGITFEVKNFSKDVLSMICLDLGGIYEQHLDGESETWPDQVAVDAYSTEFSAYIFYSQWEKDGEEKWLRATEAALNFFIVNYLPYTCISFDSYEFKILPILCLLDRLNKNNHENLFPTDKLKNIIFNTWQKYDPVNVYAMRLANMAVMQSVGIGFSKVKFLYALYIIQKNQTAQGLICDNRGGSITDSTDLTYHQFSLACLSLAYEYTKNYKLKSIIDKAMEFSRYVALPDGHVSYYGRGSNNIYHLASYIFSESISNNTNYDNISKVILLLRSFRQKDGSLPAALNNFWRQRMGWNHASMPYNAQTGFFLSRAYDALSNFSNSSGNIKKEQGDIILDNPDYLKLNNSNYQIVIGRGGDAHEWSGGVHISGMAGIAAIAVKNSRNILLVNEFNVIDNLYTGDIPCSHSDFFYNYTGDLVKIGQDQASIYFKEQTVNYKIEGDKFFAEYLFKYSVKYFGGLSFQEDLIKDFYIKNNRVGIYFIDGSKINIEVPYQFEIKNSVVSSNPYGKGVRFEWIKIDSMADVREFKWTMSLRN